MQLVIYAPVTRQMTGKPNQKITLALLQPIAAVTTPFEHLIIDCKTFIFSSFVLLLCVHTRYNLFAHPSCSYYYLLSPSILFLHFLFYCTFYSLFLCCCFFTYIYALVLCYFYIIFILLHCPLSGPDLIYISLLIIPCIIYYVTNKETLNLEP